MATERQIAANRRNAGKSTGPRSFAGKKRARQNAYHYGLAVGPTSSAAFAKKAEKLARKIAGYTRDEIILGHARDAAYAELDLARVRRVVRLGVFVNSTPTFTDQPKIANGASDLMVEIFGEAGRHARSAVGVNVLPLGVAVEVDGIFEIEPPRSP